MAKHRSEWGDALLMRRVQQHMGGVLFHLGDEANAASIDEHGLLSRSEAAVRGIVPFCPGGNGLTRALDEQSGLGDYVFLSFQRSILMPKDDSTDWRRRPLRLHVDPEILLQNGVLVRLGRRRSSDVFNSMRAYYEMDWEIFFDDEMKEKAIGGGKARWNTFLDYEILIPKRVPREFLVGSD